MITFPNAKINLGLNITSRRTDGYHTIESVFYPVPWCDILEIVPASGPDTTLTVTGRKVDCPVERNLVYRAWRLMHDEAGVPAVDICLRKVIPDGAGLGGGSSDAAFTLRMLRDMFVPDMTDDTLAEMAAKLGSDCPFFIYNTPMAVSDIGTVMRPCDISLAGMRIVIVKPQRSVSTAEAYSRVTPRKPARTAPEIVSGDMMAWRHSLVNDFEESVFGTLAECAAIKQALYDAGALYASMSGSGSSVYGIFSEGDTQVTLPEAVVADAALFEAKLT